MTFVHNISHIDNILSNAALVPNRLLTSRLQLDVRSNQGRPRRQLSFASSVILSRWDRPPIDDQLHFHFDEAGHLFIAEQNGPVMVHRPRPIEHIDPSNVKCIVCFDDGKKEDFITSSCNRHSMCRQCLNTYMKQPSYNHPINNLGKKFICPFDGCKGVYDLSEVYDKIDEDTKTKLNDHLNSLPESCGFPYTCGHCNHVNHLDITDPGNKNEPITCESCQHDICKYCCATDHCDCPAQGWVNCALTNENEEPKYVIQKKELTDTIMASTLFGLLSASIPFNCKCSHCGSQLERSEACTELKHCNISTCSLCGLKAKPGETQIDSQHWNECFRYEEDLFEHVKIPYQSLNHDKLVSLMSSLRRALHVIRFFKFLSPSQKLICKDLINDWLLLDKINVHCFNDFQYGITLMRWGYEHVSRNAQDLQSLNLMIQESIETLVYHTDKILPHYQDEDDSSEEESFVGMAPLENQTENQTENQVENQTVFQSLRQRQLRRLAPWGNLNGAANSAETLIRAAFPERAHLWGDEDHEGARGASPVLGTITNVSNPPP